MTLEELMNEWEKDSIIDPLDLSDEAIKTGKLHSKYAKYLSTHSMISRSKWAKFRERREWKRKYYRGDFNNPDDLKKYGIEPYRGPSIATEIANLIDGDEELNNLLLSKEYHDEIVKFCESVIRELNSRTYAIGNAIRYNIFMGGG